MPYNLTSKRWMPLLALPLVFLMGGACSSGSKTPISTSSATGQSLSGTSVVAPNSLTATTVSGSEIDLTWVTGQACDSFVLSQSTDGTTFTPVNSAIAGSLTSYAVITGLSPGTKYYFEIACVAGGITSSPSSIVAGTTGSTGGGSISPPTNFTATAVSTSEIDLNWVCSGCTTISVLQSSDGVNFTTLGSPLAGTATFYKVTGLSTGTKYYFEVTQTTNGVTSSPSSIASATTLTSAPSLAPPSALAAAAQSRTSVALSWVNNAAYTAITVYQSPDGVNFSSVQTIAGTLTTALITAGLNPATNYYFAVSGTANSVTSNESNVAMARTLSTMVPIDSIDQNFTPYSVYRANTAPNPALWFLATRSQPFPFGAAGSDVPVVADYTGSGRPQMALFRPSTAEWFILGVGTVQYGAPGDIPVPADYDGVGHAQIAVYRPTTGQWIIQNHPGGVVGYGDPSQGDLPIPGDYDGVGHAQMALYRTKSSDGKIYWLVYNGQPPLPFGAPGIDIPIPADYDGTGKLQKAVYRTTTAQWIILGHTGAIPSFGNPGVDIPIPGDYLAEGHARLAVFQPNSATFIVYLNSNGPSQYGWPGVDIPLPGINPISYAGAKNIVAGAASNLANLYSAVLH